MSEIQEKVCGFVAKITKRDLTEISVDLRLAEDLGIKSVGRIELAALIEDELGVVINNFEIRKPKSINDVIALIESKS